MILAYLCLYKIRYSHFSYFSSSRLHLRKQRYACQLDSRRTSRPCRHSSTAPSRHSRALRTHRGHPSATDRTSPPVHGPDLGMALTTGARPHGRTAGADQGAGARPSRAFATDSLHVDDTCTTLARHWHAHETVDALVLYTWESVTFFPSCWAGYC